MVLFTLAIVSLLSIINICRLQSHIGNALNRTALSISEYSYFYYVSGVYSAASSIKSSAAGDGFSQDKIPDMGDLLGYAAGLLGNDGNDAAQAGSISEAVQKLLESGLSQGLETAESALIAAPITRLMFKENFGAAGEDADAFLRSMGVSDGLDGLDFSLSAFFPAESPCDIWLSVCYRVKIPFLGGLRITVLQNSRTGAWLGGDESRYNLIDGTSGGNNPENTTEASLWKMPAFERGLRFREAFSSSQSFLSEVEGMRGVIGYDAASDTYYNCVSINTFSESYNSGGFNEAAACEHTLRKIKITVSEVSARSEEGARSNIEYTVFIPEDASDAVAAEIRKYLEEKSVPIEEDYPSVNLIFRIVKAGGKANE